jgi:hypothetical protein
MVPIPRRLALLLLASGLTLPGQAQSLGEACRLLPADTAAVEVRRDPALMARRWPEALARLGSKDGSKDPADILSAALAGAPGLARKPFLVVADFPASASQPGPKAFVLPVADFKAFSRAMKAHQVEGLLTGQLGSGTYFIARHGKFALLAGEASTLLRFSGRGGNLGQELDPLLPWISSHDLALILPAAATRKGLDKFANGLATAGMPATRGLATTLAPMLAKLQASLTQVALAVDLPEDGGIYFHGRAFLAPGSAMAKVMAVKAGSQDNPLAGLSSEGYLFAFGGSMPPGLAGVNDLLQPALLAKAPSPEQAARLEDLLPLQKEMLKALRTQAFRLALPRHPGAPILGNVQILLNVDDPEAYLGLLGRMAAVQESSGLAPWGHVHADPDVLPGIPSLSLVTELNPVKSMGPGPSKVLLSLLFGYPDRMILTYGKVGDHTLLAAMGGAEEWQLAAAAKVAPFGADPLVAAADAHLPPGSSFRCYLDFKALAEMVNGLLGSMPAGQTLPPLQVPAAPPLALAFSCDATGMELSAVATRATLDAVGVFVQEVPKLMARPGAVPRVAQRQD